MKEIKKTFENKILLQKCKSKDLNSKEKFINKISEYIATFPIRQLKLGVVYNISYNNDIINNYNSNTEFAELDEFYLIILEKIKKCSVFGKYNLDLNFKTYFDKILYNTFITLYNKNLKNKHLSIDAENKNNNMHYEIEDKNELKDNNILDKLEKIIEISLKIKDKIILKLIYIYYFDLSEEEILELSKITDKTLIEISNILLSYKQYLIKNKKDKLPLNKISKFLNITENSISVRLKRIREKLNKFTDEFEWN